MNETKQTIIEGASAMPAPTWRFLKMNDMQVVIPEGLPLARNVTTTAPQVAEADEFERAIARAQEAWESAHPAPTAEELAERAEFLAAEADATYGGTAQSTYQAAAAADEDARSLAVSFKNGVGEELAAYLRHAAGNRIIVKAEAGKAVDAEVVVTGVAGAINVAAIDVVAEARAVVNLTIAVVGDAESSDAESSDAGQPAFTGSTVRVFADDNAQVNIVRTQTLGGGFTDVDDMGLFTADSARINVRQTVLGASTTLTGLAGDLRGDASRVDVDTRYLGHGTQSHDFNYLMRQHGKKTQCNMQANGVLAGKSSKTLRGTIDLIRGCKGAEGSENETVLLVDKDVCNKTISVILCNEDDVVGNHGATIGHIRDEQLFYLGSRGLSPEAAERMFVGAMMEQAVIDAPDDVARGGVLRLGEQLVPGFAGLFEEE